MTVTGAKSKSAAVKALNTGAKKASEAGLAARRERVEALLALIARRKREIVEAFYDIGEALRELRDKKLFVALGFDTFDALLKAKKVIGRTQAYKLLGIVSAVPREIALELGEEKSWSLVMYTRATPESDSVEALVKKRAPVVDRSARAIEAETDRIESATTKKSAARLAREKVVANGAKALRAMLRARGVKSPAVIELDDGARVVLTIEHLRALVESEP